MKPKFEYGTNVRLTRNVRNDGTYPGEQTGALLVRRGEIGAVYDVGTYLQDQLIYRVHFLEAGRTVGCREEELIPADAPWINNLYEFRDKVTTRNDLNVGGEVVARQGDEGEIEKVLKTDGRVFYHCRFHGRTFQVPEALLEQI